MGTDIHAVVQYKVGGEWKTKLFPNKWYGKYEDEKEFTPHYDMGRNYDTFAILANVRNGYGFAGRDTGDGFFPISEPKGLPEDLGMTEVQDTDPDNGDYGHRIPTGETVWLGDHSFSWISLSELEGYDFSRGTKKRGWISASERKAWLESGNKQPESWCGGISGGNIDHVSIEEMDRRIRQDELIPGAEYYALAEWGIDCGEAAPILRDELLPMMQELSKQEGVEEVRLVFGFDS